MLARLGKQRIADHPAIAGVFLDRLGRQLVIGGKLAANLGDAVRLAPRQLVEIALHAGAGRFCIGLGKGQQADREIGHPVPHLAERDLRVVRLLDRPEQVGRLDHAGGIVGKLAGQIDIGRDQHGEQGARQQDQPGPDRQPGQDPAAPPRPARRSTPGRELCAGCHRRAGRLGQRGRNGHSSAGQRYSVMLITPPRSSCLAPSFG